MATNTRSKGSRYGWARVLLLLAAIVGAGLLAEVFIVGSGDTPRVNHIPEWLVRSAILSVPFGGIGYALGGCKHAWASYLGLLAFVVAHVSFLVSHYMEVVNYDEKGMFVGPDWLLFLHHGGDMWFVPLPIALACFWFGGSRAVVRRKDAPEAPA